MKFLKHILIVLALLFAAVPCMHGELYHGKHHHDHETAAQLCAGHTCECHDCENMLCNDALDLPQNVVSGSAFIFTPLLSKPLIVFNEVRPVLNRIPLPVSESLRSIQTVRLLI